MTVIAPPPHRASVASVSLARLPLRLQLVKEPQGQLVLGELESLQLVGVNLTAPRAVVRRCEDVPPSAARSMIGEKIALIPRERCGLVRRVRAVSRDGLVHPVRHARSDDPGPMGDSLGHFVAPEHRRCHVMPLDRQRRQCATVQPGLCRRTHFWSESLLERVQQRVRSVQAEASSS